MPDSFRSIIKHITAGPCNTLYLSFPVLSHYFLSFPGVTNYLFLKRNAYLCNYSQTHSAMSQSQKHSGLPLGASGPLRPTVTDP